MFSCIWHLKHCKGIKQYSKLILDLFPKDLDFGSLVSRCKTLHDVEQDYCHLLVATSKTYLKLSKLVSIESGLEKPCFNFEKYYFCWFGLRQPCFNLEKHNWCWATIFQPDLDLSNLISSWKSPIYDEQPCFHLIWPWELCFISEKRRWLSNLVSTWFGLEQSCFILEKHN